MGNDQNLLERLRFLEDRIAIYDILASHPLGSDAASDRILEAVYSEDTIVDRGPGLSGACGCSSLLSLVHSAAHTAAIQAGLVHFTNLPLVELCENRAFATSYVMLLSADSGGGERELPNHGVSKGHWIHRIVVSRWELEKNEGKWKVTKREMRFHDGSDETRTLIARAESYFGE